jgi:HEAT repeat protein
MAPGEVKTRHGRVRSRLIRLARRRLALLVLGMALVSPAVAWSQPIDPVEALRLALQEPCHSAESRDQHLKECLAALSSLGDLQRAVTLPEWRLGQADLTSAAVDQANRELLVEWFRRAVRKILEEADDRSVEVVADVLAQMGAAAQARDASSASGGLNVASCFAPELAALALSGPPRLRRAAAHALGQIDPDVSVAVPALGQLLESADPNLRRTAAESLAGIVRNAAQAVASRNGRGPGVAARRKAIHAAIHVLPTAAFGLNDIQSQVRCSSLGCIHSAAALLVQLAGAPLAEDNGGNEGSQSGLLSFPEARAELGPLFLALGEQGPSLVRALGDGTSDVRVLGHETVEHLAQARWCWSRRLAAAGVRGEEAVLGGVLQDTVPALTEALQHPEARVRRTALDALEALGPLAAPAVPALIRTLRDPDRFLRWSAIRTLGGLGPLAGDRAAPGLTRLLQDPDIDVRVAAAKALDQVVPARLAAPSDDARRAPAIEQAAYHPSRSRRLPLPPPALLRSLEDGDPILRVMVLRTLRNGQIDARPAVPALRRLLADADPRVRLAAIEVLGTLGEGARSAVEELRLALHDPDRDVSRAATALLLRLVAAQVE